MVIRSLKCAVLAMFLSLLPVPAAADAIVPGSLATVEGNGENCFPFTCSGSIRYQQVYGAQEFGIIPMWIDAILFRPDSGPADAFSNTATSLQIDLSTTHFAPDALLSVFALNVGADNTTVRTGSLSFSSADVAGPGNARAFDILIPFSQSFFYNPTLGNLLLDIRFVGNILPRAFLDSHNAFGDSTSRVFANGEVNATSGVFSTSGLVTKFQTSSVNAVPDTASSLSLLVFAMGSLGAARRWTRNTLR